MKFRQLNGNFEKYLSAIYYNSEEADETTASSFIERIRDLQQLNETAFGMPILYLIDYSRQEYVIFSDSSKQLMGYHPRDFLDAGLEMLRHVFHKDDYKVYCEEIFARNCEFLKNTPKPDHDRYVFSFTFRVKNGRGGWQQIFQRGGYITSPSSGLPLYSLGICLNITTLSDDVRMIHTIEERQPDAPFERKLLEKNFFYPNFEDTLFTQREKDVLKYMADGLSTKEISVKMKVAETTVISHRKNMMEKSNTRNAVELVAFALKKRII